MSGRHDNSFMQECDVPDRSELGLSSRELLASGGEVDDGRKRRGSQVSREREGPCVSA